MYMRNITLIIVVALLVLLIIGLLIGFVLTFRRHEDQIYKEEKRKGELTRQLNYQASWLWID